MKKIPSISIFFPCYNDSKSIGKLVKNAFTTVRKLTNNYEVIVVDDGSTDTSSKVLKKLAKRYSKLKLVFHQQNQGYGGTLQTGFKVASKELLFYTDGDGQYDVRELPILLQLMTDDVSFVNGIKMARKDSTYRIIIGNLYSFVTRWMFLLPVYDIDCDFRLIRKNIIDKLNLKTNSGAICIELVKKSQKAKATFREVSVHHFERKWGESQFFIPGRILSTLWEVGLVWFQLMIFEKFKKSK